MSLSTLHSARHCYRIFLAFLCLTLVACASSPSTDPNRAGVLNTNWLNYEDAEATTFAKQCRIDFIQAHNAFRSLEKRTKITSEKLLSELNDLHIVLDKAMSKASLYRSVHPNKIMRNAANECFQNFYALNSEIGLSQRLYRHLSQIDQQQLDDIDKKYVTDLITLFERAGVALSEEKRTQLKTLDREIRILGQDFSRNIREDQRKVALDSEKLLEGLPQDFIEAHPANEQGQIIVSTDYPDYHPIMRYAKNDRVRYELYRLFRKRGHPLNASLLQQLLEKRYEYAQLLGYENFAAYITADQMIESPQQAQEFIDKINELAKQKSANEYQVLLGKLQQLNPESTTVGDWQKTYLEELVRQEQYNIDSQTVRQYFHFEKVKKGILSLTEDLFNVRITPWKTDIWHENVEAYSVWDGQQLIGRFYLDLHPRDGKYKHAAAFGVQDGVKGVQEPIAALVCNFPTGYMEHKQVETFLHEFGHLLHALFGGHQKWLALSGIKTERDFVEAPSQMLEEWIWDYETLSTFASNDEGETIPKALVDKMNNARHFGIGLYTRHQNFYAATSLNFYNQQPEFDLLQELQELQTQYSPFSYVEDTYFYTNFGHLYSYSALYYTYLWSKVIAADLFSEFERLGLRNPTIARRYRETILEPGGTEKAATLVQHFLGRPYSLEAYAKQLLPIKQTQNQPSKNN